MDFVSIGDPTLIQSQRSSSAEKSQFLFAIYNYRRLKTSTTTCIGLFGTDRARVK